MCPAFRANVLYEASDQCAVDVDEREMQQFKPDLRQTSHTEGTADSHVLNKQDEDGGGRTEALPRLAARHGSRNETPVPRSYGNIRCSILDYNHTREHMLQQR